MQYLTMAWLVRGPDRTGAQAGGGPKGTKTPSLGNGLPKVVKAHSDITRAVPDNSWQLPNGLVHMHAIMGYITNPI